MRDSETFEQFLTRSIEAGLKKVFDETTLRAVEFYIDTKTAAKDPEAYARSLQKMFGGGSHELITNITDILSDSVGMQAMHWNDFSECVGAVKKKYESAAP